MDLPQGLVLYEPFLGAGAETALDRQVALGAGQGYRVRSAVLRAEFEQGGLAAQLLLRCTQALITQMGQVVVCNRHHSIGSRLCSLVLPPWTGSTAAAACR